MNYLKKFFRLEYCKLYWHMSLYNALRTHLALVNLFVHTESKGWQITCVHFGFTTIKNE